VRTLWDPILFTRHSTGTFRQCTHYGIPYCLQDTVPVHSDSAHTMGSHTVYKTQYRYIQTVHTLWDPYCLQIVLTLKFMYELLVDVFNFNVNTIVNNMDPIVCARSECMRTVFIFGLVMVLSNPNMSLNF